MDFFAAGLSLLNFKKAADKREEDVVANVSNMVDIEGNEEKNPPKKRMIALTGCFLCLTFIIFALNLITDLISNLISNDKMWKYLTKLKCYNKSD